MILYQPKKSPLTLHNTKLVEAEIEQNPPSPQLQAEIDTLWEKSLHEASLGGKQLFDDSVLCLSSFNTSPQDDTLTIFTNIVPYRTRFIAKKYPHIGEEVGKLRALFTHVIVRTSDNFYIFGKKSAHYVTDLTTCFIGGTLNDGVSLSDHVYEELQEEIGIQKNDVIPSISGIYENSIGNIGIVLEGALPMSSQEFRGYFESWVRQQIAPEISEVTLVHHKELAHFMNREFNNYPDVATIITNGKT